MTTPGDGFRFSQVRHWHQAEGCFFMVCFSIVESCGCKKNLGLSCGEWFGHKQQNARMRFFSSFFIQVLDWESQCVSAMLSLRLRLYDLWHARVLCTRNGRNPEKSRTHTLNFNPQHFNFHPKPCSDWKNTQ